MSLDVVADVDAGGGIAQTGLTYKRVFPAPTFLSPICYWSPNRQALMKLRVLFPEPIARVYLRVGFGESLIPEVQSTACILAGIGAVDYSCGEVKPVGEFVDEKGPHRRSVGAKSSWRAGSCTPNHALFPWRNAVTRPQISARPRVQM